MYPIHVEFRDSWSILVLFGSGLPTAALKPRRWAVPLGGHKSGHAAPRPHRHDQIKSLSPDKPKGGLSQADSQSSAVPSNPSSPTESPYLSLPPPSSHSLISAFWKTRIIWLVSYPQHLNAVAANSSSQ